MKRAALLLGFLLLLLYLLPAPRVREIEIFPAQPMYEFERANISLEKKGGRVLIDISHDNSFSPAEYSRLFSLLSEAGYEVELVKENLIASLGGAKALVMISPAQLNEEEINEIERFVRRGGSLLLINDPASWSFSLNELGLRFGMAFVNDYVYDLHEHFYYFKYPLLTNFVDHELTRNLSKLAIYEGCSLSLGKAEPIVLGGKNTRSSLVESKELVLVGISKEGLGKVFAVCDRDIFSDKRIGEFNNEEFLINLLNWMV